MITKEMTSKERVFAAFRDEPCDCIPLISPVSLANVECMQLARASFPQANLNSQKMAALAETSYTILQFDSMNPYFSIAAEAYAFGCNVDWGDTSHMPNVLDHGVSSLGELKEPASFFDSKPIKSILGALKLLHTRYQNRAAVFGKIIGPMSLIFYIYGIQNTLNALILSPQELISALQEMSDLCIRFALAQLEAGADIITISEDGAGDLISRECYREILMPFESKIYQAIHPYAPVVFHLSCRIMDKADLFARSGFEALNFDSRNDISELKKLTGNMKLIGCVNNPVTLLNGDPKDVAREVEYSIRSGVSFVSPECSIPIRVSNTNLLAMRDAVTAYTNKYLP